MADFVASFGLSDAEFQRGIRRVQQEGLRTSREMERGWGRVGTALSRLAVGASGMMVIRRGFMFATSAAREFADETGLADHGITRMDRAWQDFQRVVGTAAPVQLFFGGLGASIEFVNQGLRDMATWGTRALGSLPGGGAVTGAAAALGAVAGSRKPGHAFIGATEEQQALEIAQAAGDVDPAGAAAARDAARQRAAEAAIRGNLDLQPAERDRLIAGEARVADARRARRERDEADRATRRHGGGRGLTVGSGVGGDIARGIFHGAGLVRPEVQTIREQVRIAKEQERKAERANTLLERIERNTAKGAAFGP